MYDYYITPDEYEIAKRNGIPRNTLEQRIRDLLWDKQRAITEPPKNMSKGYGEYAKKAEKIGVKSNTFYTRVKRGWSPERAATTPIIKTDNKFLDEQRKKGIKKIRKYPDWVYEELKKNNINRDTFWRRVNTYKWSVEKACTTPVQEKGKYDRSDHVFRKYDKLTFAR